MSKKHQWKDEREWEKDDLKSNISRKGSEEEKKSTSLDLKRKVKRERFWDQISCSSIQRAR